MSAVYSFKGCLSSAEANQAAADGARSIVPDAQVTQVPVSDGGEGFLEAYRSAVGGQVREIVVKDPLSRPVRASYLLNGTTVVIEMAQASGLMLLRDDERNPLTATSYGTGQLIADALRSGAEQVIVGLGGSATNDAGVGMLRALIDRLAPGGTWSDVRLPGKVRFTIASDVRNPLYGSNGAAHVFAPQKGATPEMVTVLDARARRFADISARHFGYDRSSSAGAGAAGGLGYALLQYLHAACRPGIDLLLEAARFETLTQDAQLIITGEGSADAQTLMGKLPMGILRHSHGVPVCLIAGRISDEPQLLQAGFASATCINPEGLPLQEAMKEAVAAQNIKTTVSSLIKRFVEQKA